MAKLYKRNNIFILDKVDLSATDHQLLEYGEYINVTVRPIDNRYISDQQRKFIFALLNEIEFETGVDSEYMRSMIQTEHAIAKNTEVQSLSNCSMTYANEIIDLLIMFCIQNSIPIQNELLKNNEFKFNENQTYMMTLKRYCIICGQRADIHHVDTIGMGQNRNKVSHIGKRALPLCRAHHNQIHNVGDKRFIDYYHLTPIVIDKKMEQFIKKGHIKLHREDVE